jgi:hypothetical protein
LIFFRPQLVVTRNLQQHAGIGAGNAGQAEESDCGAHDKYVKVMHGDGDFAQLPVVPAGHKKNVKTFLQIAPRSDLMEKSHCNQVRNSRPSSCTKLRAESLFGTLIVVGHGPHLGNGNHPVTLPNLPRTELEIVSVRNANILRNLARPKVV